MLVTASLRTTLEDLGIYPVAPTGGCKFDFILLAKVAVTGTFSSVIDIQTST